MNSNQLKSKTEVLLTDSETFIDGENKDRVYLRRKYFNKDKNIEWEYTICHSKHSRVRASQRSINYKTILKVLDFGTSFHKQGMVFYTFLEKNCPVILSNDERKKLKNLVVVMNGPETKVITCYQSKNAVKQLKKKGSTLLRAS